MTSHTTSQESGWYSVKEACRILDISRRTLYDRIEFKKIDTKKEGKRRLVWLHLTPQTTSHTTSQTQESPLESSFDIDRAKELEQNLKYFRDKCDRLEIQISEQSTRHDAVVLKLSNTIERQQLMIGESKSSGLFQKLFGWMTG